MVRFEAVPHRAGLLRQRTANQAARLSGAGAFEAIFRHGSRREGQYVQVVYAPARSPASAPSASAGRVGFVIGRKVLPRAVDRNRLKRMLREFLRASRPAVGAFDLVIRLKRPVATTLLTQVVREAGALMRDVIATGPPGAGGKR